MTIWRHGVRPMLLRPEIDVAASRLRAPKDVAQFIIWHLAWLTFSANARGGSRSRCVPHPVFHMSSQHHAVERILLGWLMELFNWRRSESTFVGRRVGSGERLEDALEQSDSQILHLPIAMIGQLDQELKIACREHVASVKGRVPRRQSLSRCDRGAGSLPTPKPKAAPHPRLAAPYSHEGLKVTTL